MSKPLLNEADFRWAAGYLQCDVPAIKAVAEVESMGAGFLPTGEPTILFEAHVFSRLTGNRYDRSNPNVSSRKWNRALYGRAGIHQHQRLVQAVSLDRDPALQSASWGKFQVMGFNWDEMKYPSLQNFVNSMYQSEGEHLKSFVKYIVAFGLANFLRNHQWAQLANGYNGPRWAENDYANKMHRAWRRHGGV